MQCKVTEIRETVEKWYVNLWTGYANIELHYYVRPEVRPGDNVLVVLEAI